MKQTVLRAALLLTLLVPAVALAQTAAPPDVAAPPADATRTSTGLATKVIEVSKNDRKATTADVVTAHYTLWTTDGKLVDSTRIKGQAKTFPLVDVIAGWRECV